jgi:chromosome segregation ATPase
LEISRKRDHAKLEEDKMKRNSVDIEEKLEKIKSIVAEKKKEIEDKLRERDLLNKDVVDKQNVSREKEGEQKNLENELKKLKNKVEGYKTETQKLRDMINQLEKDKDKYGTEASQANAKYYQCMEKVKMKSTLITKLQKKNAEAEARLKQQQNLYEAVRSDRNLYSKNLLEAVDEISELRFKFRRLTYTISQLKDEMTNKETAIQKERTALTRHNKENDDLQSEIRKKEGYIKSLDQMIKTQEADIGRLKYVITEAEAEKQKQRKDYEMVINERDILGTQLIKREEELQLLYEKIKIQQSTLKKGEIYYQKKHEEIEDLKATIADIKKQIIVHQNETACIEDLKKEIYLLQKELVEQQQKDKILTQELEKPMNVHRWRKLECTEPEIYEKIQKIQSLQKRLIAKTEEVQEKDVLIQEKEKLYVELKNILAKQSGPEVAEKLATYQQNLKERTKQLREMASELKSYQSQVSAYKFEIERLDKAIVEVKKQYYNHRRRETRNQPLDGDIIEEEDEGDLRQEDELDHHQKIDPHQYIQMDEDHYRKQYDREDPRDHDQNPDQQDEEQQEEEQQDEEQQDEEMDHSDEHVGEGEGEREEAPESVQESPEQPNEENKYEENKEENKEEENKDEDQPAVDEIQNEN